MPWLNPDNKQLPLATLQKQFWISCRNYHNDIYHIINEQPDFMSDQRMNVYRTTARSAHVSALMDSYPVCREILGEDYFKQLARAFFRQTPSRSADMNAYGDTFPGYIAQLAASREELKSLIFLVDLARLEWEIQNIYSATDAVTFDANKFESSYQKMGDKIVLKCQPCTSFMSSSFRVFEIWNMHRKGTIKEIIAAADIRQYLCVYKKSYKVIVEKVNPEIYELLVCIKQHKTLAEIASIFEGRYDLDATLTTVVAKQWLAS